MNKTEIKAASNFGPNKLNSLQIRDIRKHREWGSTLAALACKYGVTVPAIRYHVKDIVPRELKSIRRTKATRVDPDAILHMVAFGHSQAAIARHFGVKPCSIGKALNRLEQQSQGQGVRHAA